MRFGRRNLGAAGERAAEVFLRRRGYAIVERNFRCPLGEIDLIALDRGAVVFVEVKTRASGVYGSPAESIGWHKRQRLRRAAETWLGRKGLHDRPARFDVVEVYWDGASARCELLCNAFDTDL